MLNSPLQEELYILESHLEGTTLVSLYLDPWKKVFVVMESSYSWPNFKILYSGTFAKFTEAVAVYSVKRDTLAYQENT